jgi:thiamine transport system ATP-binding protein
MLEIRGASITFGATTALDDVDLTVETGERMALLGPSGSGKTTLLRAVAGLERLDTGSVSWDGRDMTTSPTHERRFGLVFQDFALFPHLDVGRNVAFGLKMQGVAPPDRTDRVAEALARVDLDGFADRAVSSLSGGQAQRVALARALVVRPRMLLLDEPLGALDRELRERLAADLRDLLDHLGITALHVTHDQEEAFAVADRVALLAGGRILQVAAPRELWRRPASEAVARFIGIRTVLDGVVTAGSAATALGEIAVPGIPDGPVRLAIRTDAVRIDDSGSLEATVVSSVFRGGDTLLRLEAGGVGLDAVGEARRGDTVRIRIDPAGVSALR